MDYLTPFILMVSLGFVIAAPIILHDNKISRWLEK